MTEPVDPIEHLDFRPTCEWTVQGARCELYAAVGLRWSCQCVTMLCSIHAVLIKPTARYHCDQHGPRETLERKEAL